MKRIFQHSYRLAVGRLFALFIGLALAGSVQATDPLYVNVSSSYYSVGGSTPNPPPTFDVTAFVNENIFSVDYLNYTLPYPFFETVNTLYYTNYGTMIASSPVETNFFSSSFSSGFIFDQQTANAHKMAGTFYNPGEIRCNSTNDGNNTFIIGGFFQFFVNSIGRCEVFATNIINPGIINAGPDGFIKLNSFNADLSFGSIFLEQPLTAGFLLNSFGFFNLSQTLPNMVASGSVGTNFLWNPATSLRTNSVVEPAPIFRSLTNITPYVYVTFAPGSTSNLVVRAVYVLTHDASQGYKVYFTRSPNFAFDTGDATVEFDGAYQDPYTGNYYTNYLYLTDDYIQGNLANVFFINGFPNNFDFVQSTTPLDLGTPASSGLPFTFLPSSFITNTYSYVDATFLSSTVATNASNINPSGSISNLAGKITITASNELTLANAIIGGENYLSLVAPNQFNGSQNAQITAPYADINLGVTNGRMEVANLIAAGVGTVGGSVQAWSTQWDYTDPSGINIDFRVMIVTSDLTPKSSSWIQTLRLHATNSLIISDVMNVYKTLNIDAQRLTITTNGYGNSFTSANGALNWANSLTFGPTQIPNVLWLTNNGTITAWNDAIFGTSSLRYAAFINNGFIGDNGTTIWTTNFVNSGTITNGSGAFALQTQRAVMTNGALYANGNVTITTSSLFITNEYLFAGRSLTILATNLLSDGGITSNIWSVGSLGNTGDGLSLPVKPVDGDLLGTTITLNAPLNKSMVNLWAGQDRGYALAGFSNNVAIGHLILDAKGSAPSNGRFTFNGASSGNAIYVDQIEFKDYSTNRDAGLNMSGITFNPNLVIYYAQAILNGSSIAEKLNLKNTNNLVNNLTSHFRWVPTYAGYFSSTNLINPDGSTNVVNAALAQSGSIDSDGDGIVNNADSTPFFISSSINLTATVTNLPPKKAKVQWLTIPGGTNYIFYATNLASPNWLPFTNFSHFYWNNNLAVSNYVHSNWFASPQAYGNPATNVWVFDGITNVQRYYRVSVQPWLTYPN